MSTARDAVAAVTNFFGEVVAETFGDAVEVVDGLGSGVFEEQPTGCAVGGSCDGEEHPWSVGVHWADA